MHPGRRSLRPAVHGVLVPFIIVDAALGPTEPIHGTFGAAPLDHGVEVIAGDNEGLTRPVDNRMIPTLRLGGSHYRKITWAWGTADCLLCSWYEMGSGGSSSRAAREEEGNRA